MFKKMLFVVVMFAMLSVFVRPALAEMDTYSFPVFDTRTVIVGTSTTNLSFGKAGLVTFTANSVVDVTHNGKMYIVYGGHPVSVVVAKDDVVKLTATSNTLVAVSFGPNYAYRAYLPMVVRP